ncbi:MAG: AAA family ATPase, partial [Spirochaetaceae bacterium]
IFPRLAKKYQLIISSHSIFPILLQKKTNLRQNTIIELSPNYSRDCLNALGRAIDLYNHLHDYDKDGF